MDSSVLARVGLLAITASVGCAPALRRFPLREPMVADDDTRPWRAACRRDEHDPKKTVCAPPEYVSPFVWDGADMMVFRPVSRFFAVDPPGESVNVNALDEVPDSSWFQNRISRRPMTEDEVALGACAGVKLNPDERWVIDAGKANGANPGFRIRTSAGEHFLVKVDENDHPERATGADAIATRIYYAAGYWTGCDSVVYARKENLELLPNLHYADNTGIRRPFGEKELERILAGAAKRGDRYRFVASKWLEGRPLGPFRYEGVRDDDPNDVVPHEDRRELRGQRVLAAWLDHFDAREQNSMTTWMTRSDDDASAPGHIRHWIIDLNDCFGSEWKWDKVTRRIGFSYYFDGGDVATDYVTLGIPQRPWDKVKRPIGGGEIFGYFESDVFDPEDWKPGYQNPAFLRMSERDAAWMARIVARFTPEHLARLVETGDFTDPAHADYLLRTLLARRQKILTRYFSIASPIADLEVHESSLCAVDLARKAGVFPPSRFRYAASAAGAPLLVSVDPGGRICVPIPKNDYIVIELANGIAEHPLRAHLYGDRLVGIER